MSALSDSSHGNSGSRKIVVLTSHIFLPDFRKASVHFVSQSWAEMGHDVTFLTVGHSWLTLLKQPGRFRALRTLPAGRLTEIAPRVKTGAHLPLVHGFSSRRAAVNAVMRPLFRHYGARLPRFAQDAIAAADIIVFESGTALIFTGLVRRLNPRARTLYFCRDLLHSVGAAPLLQAIEREQIPRFDSICVPAASLGRMLPPGGRVHVVPQGVDTALFDRADTSPYPPGTRNAIAVGDMLFDQAATEALAAAAPEVTFHLFGIHWHDNVPENVKLHGERSFESIVPYIRHADIGLAPYRMSEREVYLAESSLKLRQYAYCRLPVLLPDIIPALRGNEIRYAASGETGWRGKIDAALAMPRLESFKDGILPWDGIATETLKTLSH